MLIYHFMFGPSYADGCPVNSSIADAFDSLIPHLKAGDVSLPRPISDFTIRRIQHALGNHGPELPVTIAPRQWLMSRADRPVLHPAAATKSAPVTAPLTA